MVPTGKSESKGRFPLPGNLLVIFVGKWSWVANGHGLLSLLMTKHGPEKIGVGTSFCLNATGLLGF